MADVQRPAHRRRRGVDREDVLAVPPSGRTVGPLGVPYLYPARLEAVEGRLGRYARRIGHVPHARAVTAATPLNNRIAAALVFLASGAVLVLEIVGLRLVGPYVGVTLQGSTPVIGVALAAIAYGAWIGGWLADRRSTRAGCSRRRCCSARIATAAHPADRPVGRRDAARRRGDRRAAARRDGPCSCRPRCCPRSPRWWSSSSSATCGRPAGWSAGCPASARSARSPPRCATGFVLVAAMPTSVILLALAALLASGRAGIGFGWVLAGEPPADLAAGTGAVASSSACRCGLTSRRTRATWRRRTTAPRVDADPRGRRSHCCCSTAPSTPTWTSTTRGTWSSRTPSGSARYVDAPAGRARSTRCTSAAAGSRCPRYVAATRPGSDNLVLELDGGLVALDRRRLGLRTGPVLRVEVGDARVNLRRRRPRRDLVVGDAFGHLVVPWHLATREMVADVRRVLRPGGVYALNVIDYPARPVHPRRGGHGRRRVPVRRAGRPAGRPARRDRQQLRHRRVDRPAAPAPQTR